MVIKGSHVTHIDVEDAVLVGAIILSIAHSEYVVHYEGIHNQYRHVPQTFDVNCGHAKTICRSRFLSILHCC